MSLNIRKNTGNDAGIVTEPTGNSSNSIASGVNDNVEITFALVNPETKPNKNLLNYAAPPNVTYTARTISKADVYSLLGQKPIVAGLKLPPLVAYSPPLNTTLNKLSSDTTSKATTTVVNNQTQPVGASSGISGLDIRPEIISVIDLSPMWKPEVQNANTNAILEKQYTDSGTFLKFQQQTKILRQESLLSIIKQVRDITKQQKTYNDIRNDYMNEINVVENNLMFIKNVVENINTIKKAFEIRLIPDDNFKINKPNSGQLQNIAPIKSFYTENMGYTTNQYEVFSETKLYLQLLVDLSQRLKNYSFKFLDQVNLGRKSDLSPINLDLSEEVAGYKFDITNFSSINKDPINATSPSTFTSFLNLLPSNPDSRIRLLTYILAKEYVVSSNLGNTKNQSILQKFNTPNVGNPFPSVIGDISPNILQVPNSRIALSSLAYRAVNNSASTVILPFENKFIEDSTNTNVVWIPGPYYYTENVINPAGNSWNTTEFETFVKNFNDTTQNAAKSLRTLMGIGLDPSTSTLITPMLLNKKILEAFYTAFDKITPQEEDVAARFDPATYAQKLALQQQRDEVQKQLDDIKANTPTGEVVSSAGTNLNTDNYDQAIPNDSPYQPHPDDIAREADILRNPPEIPILEKKIEELNRKINAITVPDPALLQPTIEQAVIMNMFSLASEYVDFKNALFQYCILAGLVRNSSNQNTGLYNILARNEINSIAKLENLRKGFELGMSLRERAGQSTDIINTIDGATLIESLKFLANDVAKTYIKYYGKISTNQIDQVVSGFSNTTGKTINLSVSQADIQSILERAALGQGTIGNINLIYQYVSLANTLFNSAQINGTNVQLLTDNSGRTRLNSLSTSTQLFMLFETFCQYAKKYSFITPGTTVKQDIFGNVQVVEDTITRSSEGTVRFDRSGDTAEYERNANVDITFKTTTSTETKVGVITFLTYVVDLTNTAAVQKAIGILTKEYKEEEAQTERQNNSFFVSLEDNKNKIQKEYSDIDTIVGIYEVIANNLNTSLNSVKQFFTQSNLKAFLQSSRMPNLDLVRNLSQIRISTQTFEDIKERTSVPKKYVSGQDTKDVEMIVSDIPTVEEYNLLEKMMKLYVPGTQISEDQIKRNFKVLSVGLPTGFVKALSDRVNKGDINNQTFKDRQSDIIKINAYVRNAKYPDLVFKPISFIFDASLFLTKKNILDALPQEGESYQAVLNRLALTDFEDPFNPVEIDLETLKKDPKYNFLTEDQYEELLINHATSYLFGLYSSLHTGVRPTEDTFIFPDKGERVLNPRMRGMLTDFFKAINVAGPTTEQNTSDILASSDIQDNVKDYFRLFTYSSIVFNTDEVKNRVLSPKLYDRIFYIPVQTYKLEIDIQRTKIYNPEINFSLYDKNLIIKNAPGNNVPKYYLTDGDSDQFIIKDIFVNIETVSDTRKFSDQITELLPAGKAFTSKKFGKNFNQIAVGPARGNMPRNNSNPFANNNILKK
jgi:hypothetical protein